MSKITLTSKVIIFNVCQIYLNELAGLQILEKREIRGKHYYINPSLVGILS